MSSLEGALIAALTGNGTVSGLVTDRVFVWGSKQGVDYPYITIQRITTPTAAFLDGPSNLDWPLIQIDCWAEDPLTALHTAEAVRTAIDAVSIMTTTPNIYAVFKDQRGPAPDEESRIFRVSQEFDIFYERN